MTKKTFWISRDEYSNIQPERWKIEPRLEDRTFIGYGDCHAGLQLSEGVILDVLGFKPSKGKIYKVTVKEVAVIEGNI